MIKLRSVIEHITYQNPENGWSVMKAKVKGYDNLVTLVGSMLDVPVGSVLLAEGNWKANAKFGNQFVVETWEEVLPATVYGIEKYLGSGLIKGIGPVYARRIVQTFGTETLDIIENSPDRLLEDRSLLAAEPATSYATPSSGGIVYDDVQLAAIRQALDSKVMVLTGGPGTGKTITTQGIIEAFKAQGLKILLAAPTGRAAKRMTEATGMEAKTIHRLLEYSPQEGYKRNDESPLDGDALIIDECSMIDIILFYNLLKAVPNNMRLVLVGDIDQLPSVGAGNVLRDIIDSERIPVVRLTRIFRQAQTSRIVMNAHRINAGQYPDIANGRQSDFFFIRTDEKEVVLDTINRRGWSPAKTTGVAYSLYNKGLISYPDDEQRATLPESVKDVIAYCATNLLYHPKLGVKAKATVITGAETIWDADEKAIAHHGVVPTGLYPVDLTPDEEHLYNIVAGHCLDIFSSSNSRLG